MLFHRLCIAKQSYEDLKEFFKLELSPFPMPLLSEVGMRKRTKSLLYEAFTPLTKDETPVGNKFIAVDGGHLLHKVVWCQQTPFGSIDDSFVKYLQTHY